MKYCLDTNVHLRMQENQFCHDDIIVPITVLEELDGINHGQNPELSYLQRRAIKRILQREYSVDVLDLDKEYKLLNNDQKIILYAKKNKATFVTMDAAAYMMAKAMGVKAEYIDKNETKEIYKGYREVVMDEKQMADFYSDLTKNIGFNTNEYMALYDTNNNLVDCLKWDGNSFVNLNTRKIKSKYLEPIVPLEDDFTQRFAFDSLYSKDITCLLGRAGTGKTILSLSYLFQALDTNKVRKAYIVYSFEPLKNNRTLGFLPGDKTEKIFGSGLGTILQTKLGGLEVLRGLMENNKVEIVPTCDLRGVEFGSEDLVFITEAQNTDAYTMKTLIQRCKEGCKIIIEGDALEQVDVRAEINGMEKLIDVFKGSKYFSCVKLKTVHRSPISMIAENIK